MEWEAQKKGLSADFCYKDPRHPYIDGEKFSLECSQCGACFQLILRSRRLVATKINR